MRKIIFIISILTSTSLQSQISWIQTNGPYGGYFNYISIIDDNEIYLDNYKSTNNGESWFPFNDNPTKSFRNVVKLSDGNLYACVRIHPYSYLYKSTNDGLSWTNVHVNFNSARVLFYFNPYLFLINGQNIYRSTDGGNSFNLLEGNFSYITKKDNDLYACSFGGSIFKSTNMGLNWKILGNYVPWGALEHIEVSYNNFIFTSSSVNLLHRSTDMGVTWEAILPAKTRSSVSIGNFLFASTVYKGLTRSTDLGDSWDVPNDILLPNDIKKNSTNELFCSISSFGIFKSTDLGNSWNQKNVGLNSQTINNIYKNDNDIFALTSDGIFLSYNNGLDWNKIGPLGYNTFGFVKNDNIWLAAGAYEYITGGYGSLLLSTNEGVNWININVPISIFYKINSIFKVSSDTILAGTGINSSVIISFDKGFTWQVLNNSPYNVLQFTKFQNKIFAVTGNNVYFSNDNGINWQISNLNLPNTNYFTIYSDEFSNRLFVGTRLGLYYSDDGIYFHPTGFSKHTTSVLKTDPSTIFIASNGASIFSISYGIWRSTDNGITWDSVNTNLPNKVVTSLIHTDDNHLLIGTNSSSIFKTVNTISISQTSSSIPSSYSLSQNYPNPFNPTTNIRFQIPESGFVTLKVFDITGREVVTLVNEQMNAGEYNYEFRMTNYELSSGVYFYRLTMKDKSGKMNFSEIKKMVIVR